MTGQITAMRKVEKNTISTALSLHVVGQKITRYVVTGLLLAAVLSATACGSDDPDEGGIIGSGMTTGNPVPVILDGVVSETSFASNGAIRVKSSDGQVTELAINSANQFRTTSLSGEGPWILRVQPSTDTTVYAIAYSDGSRNINRFTDLSLRHWFARRSLDLDAQFASPAQFTALPDADEYAESVSTIFQLVNPVLTTYGISGEDVISGDYIVNDQVVSNQGIDTFLKRNTVLIENRVVKFLITDPATETQSVTKSSLTLDNDFRDTGTSPPTIPNNIKALGSATNEIVLVWDPSRDDVAVVEYEVIRDGVVIATTPYPVFIDSDLLSNRLYFYEIVAIDVAGNRSATSPPQSGTPLQMNDDVAPPAPTLLTRLTTTTDSTIRLLWEQSEIGDVVRWTLYRGPDAQATNVLLRLTSNSAIDTTVERNQTYCYRVKAFDASGNESDFSDALCVSASDADPSNNATNEPLIDWNVPDVDSLSCEQVISNTQVRQGLTVIDEGCYLVPETLSIGAGATLRLSAGVVLKFGQAAKLFVPSGATLTANGTTRSPVVLTGNISARGYWGGIEFQESTSAENSLSGTVIQYGGGGDVLAAISVINGASRFRMVDTLVRFNEKQAIHFNFNNIVIDEFRGNRITDNVAIGTANLDLVQSLGGNSDFSGNAKDLLEVPRNNYSGARITIPDIGVPLDWNGVNITRGSLTIEPGVEIEMVPDAIINVDGEFTAIGTTDLPIVFGGNSNTSRPNWGGINLTGRGDKTINHVNIIDGGSSRALSGAINFYCTAEDAARLSIDNVEISFSASWGIFISAQNCSAEIGDNVNYYNNASGDIFFLEVP